MAARGVRYIPLEASDMNRLPLAAAWTRGTRDPVRDEMLEMLKARWRAMPRRLEAATRSAGECRATGSRP